MLTHTHTTCHRGESILPSPELPFRQDSFLLCTLERISGIWQLGSGLTIIFLRKASLGGDSFSRKMLA